LTIGLAQSKATSVDAGDQTDGSNRDGLTFVEVAKALALFFFLGLGFLIVLSLIYGGSPVGDRTWLSLLLFPIGTVVLGVGVFAILHICAGIGVFKALASVFAWLDRNCR
jgi:hypothetical protein